MSNYVLSNKHIFTNTLLELHTDSLSLNTSLLVSQEADRVASWTLRTTTSSAKEIYAKSLNVAQGWS